MADLTLIALAAYAPIGVAWGFAFVWRGVERIDPAARGGGWGFRLLIWPGAAALWPLLASRWLRAARFERDRP